MALKIRFRQQGRRNRIFYRLVVTDSRSPRDGHFVEAIGWYNPLEHESEKHADVRVDRVAHWLNVGAEPTDKALSLLKRTTPTLMNEWMEKARKKREKEAAQRKAKRKAAA